jgi:hypothetical protein
MVSYEGEQRRQAKANEIAQGFQEKLSWPPQRWEVFAPPWVLLREGAICYINGLFMAAALMARASLETAVYLAISTDIYEEPGTKKVNLSYTDERDWGKILAEALKRKYLTKKDVKDIAFVRDYGNLTAHWGQKVHHMVKGSQTTQVSTHGGRNDPFTFQSTVPSVDVSKFTISEAKATAILRKNVRVLKSLADRL